MTKPDKINIRRAIKNPTKATPVVSGCGDAIDIPIITKMPNKTPTNPPIIPPTNAPFHSAFI